MEDDLLKLITERRIALIETLGMFALKTLLTLNAGATVVLLALLGNVSSGKVVAVDVAQLQCAMLLFLAGVLLVLIGVLITYIIAQAEVGYGKQINPGWHLFSQIVAPALSFLCFAAGFITATYAFTPLG